MTDRATVAPPRRFRADRAMLDVERAARAYAALTHGNLSGEADHRREELRDRLLDALAKLDAARRFAA